MSMIVLAHCSNGYCGCDSEEVFFYEDDTPELVIDEDLVCWAQENAESYAYVHFGWEGEYTEEKYDEYLEDYVSYDWHVATYEEYLDWCDNWNYEPKTEEEIAKYLSE